MTTATLHHPLRPLHALRRVGLHHRMHRTIVCCVVGAILGVLVAVALSLPSATGGAPTPAAPSAGSPTATTLPGPGTP